MFSKTSGNDFSASRRLLAAAVLVTCFAAVMQGAVAGNIAARRNQIAKIIVTPASNTVGIDATDQFTAVAKDFSNHIVNGVSFTWASSNTGTVSINRSSGLATGVSTGNSRITATSHGVTGGTALRVLSPPTVISGIAAKGSPVQSAMITLVDSTGKTRTTTTGSDGSYSITTTGLTPPFLVAVQVDLSTTFYSVSSDASPSVINVTPLTDLIIRSWYSVQGVDTTTAFANPVTNPPPSPATVQIISNVVVDVTSLWLQANGVDTSNFNPISTAFSADGTGVDAVLGETSINTDTGAISITDGTTTQSSTVTYDTGTSSLSVSTTTTGPNGSSSSTAGTVVPTSSQQSALDGITATLNAFSNTITTLGSNLADTDILPYLDDNLLSEGLDKALFADSIATEFRGNSFAAQVQSIPLLDTGTGLAAVDFAVTRTQGLNSQSQTVEFFFKQQGGGNWLLYGDQLPTKLSVESEMRTNQGAYTQDNGPDINVDIRPIKGVYSGVTIDGGGVFSNAALMKGGTEADIFKPSPSSSATVEVDRDEFFQNTGVLNSLVPAGTALTLTLTPNSGSPVDYTVHTNAFTTEPISITNLSSSSIADANLGGPLHVEWTLPTTFAIARVKLSAQVFTGDQTQQSTISCNNDGPILSITSTSGDITLATTCAGQPVLQANLNVEVDGVNGERATIIYQFQ